MEKLTIKRQVRRVIAILGMAVLCACLLTALMLYVYSPSGRYLAGNALLAPSVMNQINLRDKHPHTGQTVNFIFDQVDFSYFDRKKGHFTHYPVSFEAYGKFYQLVASEKSLEKVEPDIQLLFQSYPVLLTTKLRTDVNHANIAAKIFQVVQFTPQNFFRIQLHGEQAEGEWAYFYQAGIYEAIMHLFMAHQPSQS